MYTNVYVYRTLDMRERNYADRVVCCVDKRLFCSLLPMPSLVCVPAQSLHVRA